MRSDTRAGPRQDHGQANAFSMEQPHTTAGSAKKRAPAIEHQHPATASVGEVLIT